MKTAYKYLIFNNMKKFIALGANTYKLKKGITPISLSWRTKTIQGWCDKVTITKTDIVIGHSIGGAVALIVASKTPPKELHLYAPTPIFLEFASQFTYAASSEFIGRIDQIKPIPKISCPVFMYIGDQESKIMIDCVKKISKKIPHSVFKLIKGADHMTIVSEYLDMK